LIKPTIVHNLCTLNKNRKLLICNKLQTPLNFSEQNKDFVQNKFDKENSVKRFTEISYQQFINMQLRTIFMSKIEYNNGSCK